MTRRVLITTGEPAGIGPDVVLQILAGPVDGAALAVAADPDLLAQRARALGLSVDIVTITAGEALPLHQPGRVHCLPVPLANPAIAGRLDYRNAQAVIDMLATACDACLQGHFQALCTAPVHKAVINDAGIAFTGHTEFLAGRCGVTQPVMLLVADDVRVALVTTHLPLARVPAAITTARVTRVGEILAADLSRLFGLSAPRIHVCGLNPHAGDGGHLGHEDEAIIAPAIAALRAAGIDAVGPLPADTAFTPPRLAECAATLAMYHDQGLPVIKHLGFGRAVNVTLGLPILRTSVDHGTALDLAGTGRAEAGSLAVALRLAISLAGPGQP